MRAIKHLTLLILATVFLYGCGGVSDIVSTPPENIDSIPLKVSELTEAEKHNWGHLDLIADTIPGMSVDKAYAELIKNRKGKKVIVAVIDSGIDIDHEDLDDVIWTNSDEKPGNGKDDDNNGYIDDVHGWNFLGDAYDEQLELTRILASGNTSHPDYARAQAEFDTEYKKWTDRKTRYDQIHQQVKNAHETLVKHFGKEDYTAKEVAAIKSEDEALNQAKQIAQYMFSNDLESLNEAIKEIEDGLKTINDRLNYHLNKDFRGRKTGDDPENINEKFYGNGNVKHSEKGESHGTHVAGIIAAERNNGKGANGVANNVEIMSIRAVPNGDEYDKDVALAIRYAVDNGASVINGSFGKSFSPHSDWVRDAIAYAAKNDVVFVHAAGNDSKNVDTEPNFPDDNINGKEISDTYIRVGALAPKYGSGLLASFSNYGKQNVDVFAPGAQVYSTTPENEYDTKGGTSMAAPAVAGVAALLRSYFPSLKASQVKQIIMDSGLEIKTKVVVGGNTDDVQPYADIVKSGKIVNAYNAMIMAAKLSK
ncbi:S8 family serine peptidase [Hyunsoonleella sp. SJ7]|uniref:S8 family serine peptidase n=1 Tax=Hyunsoonleella aquatilis TaxID=2762758 RepID=A0A923HHJ8_9FLAO|nr:S8 family serine peptidase [Hyunsoonleella aquatilis]MBC3758507.1 S8 family serine peptidase [Hyunsoonleella aquatilis]